MKPEIICIVGPTATGKSDLAVELALALGGEVVSCDSMQVYRGMDVGTAKVPPEERRGVPHHMLDVADPKESYSAARYAEEAGRVLGEIAARGHVPIVCGGTGLYLDALLRPAPYNHPGGDGAVRTALENEAASSLPGQMHQMLREVDPESARRIHPNDHKRVLRAMEVYRLTGRPLSEHHARDAQHRKMPPGVLIIGLGWADRAELYRRIDRRVDLMVERGLEAEVQALLDAGVSREATAMQGIGYKELVRVLDGEMERAEAVASVKQSSRRYAKRQLTWFRALEGLQWLEGSLSPQKKLELSTEIFAHRAGSGVK